MRQVICNKYIACNVDYESRGPLIVNADQHNEVADDVQERTLICQRFARQMMRVAFD